MTHYITIIEDQTLNNTGQPGYRASCKCGWINQAARPAEIAQRAKTHLEKSNTDIWKFGWRAMANYTE